MKNSKRLLAVFVMKDLLYRISACKLILNSEVVQIKSVVPKAITKELGSRVSTPPTA